jgi:hypothetical protein
MRRRTSLSSIAECCVGFAETPQRSARIRLRTEGCAPLGRPTPTVPRRIRRRRQSCWIEHAFTEPSPCTVRNGLDQQPLVVLTVQGELPYRLSGCLEPVCPQDERPDARPLQSETLLEQICAAAQDHGVLTRLTQHAAARGGSTVRVRDGECHAAGDLVGLAESVTQFAGQRQQGLPVVCGVEFIALESA